MSKESSFLALKKPIFLWCAAKADCFSEKADTCSLIAGAVVWITVADVAQPKFYLRDMLMEAEPLCQYHSIVGEIAAFGWQYLTRVELMAVAWAYYYFSVQFRESLNLACEAYPEDPRLQALRDGECDTDNLSPYLGVAKAGERMNHDEFMRRALSLVSLDEHEQARLTQIGLRYLAATRKLPGHARAMSIPTYEDGGLETVFRAILAAPDWEHPALNAFRHFLKEHIRFDSDSENGHGALSRHLRPDGETLLLWTYFRNLFLEAVPSLAPAEQELCA